MIHSSENKLSVAYSEKYWLNFVKQKRKTLQSLIIGITKRICFAKLSHRIPIVVYYSEIKILFPVLRKMITRTDIQIKNVQLRNVESNINQINNKKIYLKWEKNPYNKYISK